MKLLSIHLLLLVLISSCINKSDNESQNGDLTKKSHIQEGKESLKNSLHINIAEAMDNEKDIFLSDIAKSVIYIPLETSPQYLIGEQSVSVKPAGGMIFIGEPKKPIGVFDMDGNFLYTIGKTGKGPGEFNFDYSFWPDPTTRKIHITNVNVKGITSYSFEGEYLGDMVIEPLSMRFAPLGNDKFVSWTFMQEKYEEKPFRVFFHDEKGSIYSRVFEDEKEYDFSRGINIITPQMTNAPEGVLYNSWEEDKIMRISPDGSFEPALTWDLGKYKAPFNPSGDYDRFQREGHKYITDLNAWEAPDNYYIKFNHNKTLNLALLNKHSEEFILAANTDTAQSGVFNDYDGGPSFWPFWYSDQGTRFFRLIQSIDLLDDEMTRNKNIKIKNQGAARKLEKIIAGLNENSNPVLMMVELK